VYSAATVLWAFLSQVMDDDQSCRATVMRVIAYLLSEGRKPCSSETGAYCVARALLPEAVFAECVRQTALSQEAQIPPEWMWKELHPKLLDGTTASMPDTEKSQAEYPQPSSQKKGLGFPLMRVLAVFSLATGLLHELRFSAFKGKYQSELGMFRELWDTFDPSDLVLADRLFCSWFELAMLQRRGVNIVMPLHQRRDVDFRRGKRLGPGDHVVEWPKPSQCPDWMDQATYDELPDKLLMREIRVKIEQPGFRTEEIIVVTTLLDVEKYPAEDVRQLYRARWNAELDLRSLKETMHMDVLRGKSPDIVRKEIWMHALAYNLIRTVIAQAALTHDILPRTISFRGTLQALKAFQPQLAEAAPAELPRLIVALWKAMVTHRVADRPGRVEPRAKKRRPKPYPLLMQPRAEARIALCRKA
jgi:hypothetical protein